MGADSCVELVLPDEAATVELGARIAQALPSEVGEGAWRVHLHGDLGAGKTAFARALIRNLTGDPALDVPSPTFTLMQLYDGASFPIAHADFYRVNSADELEELGFDETLEHALLIVEWAERVGVLEAPGLGKSGEAGDTPVPARRDTSTPTSMPSINVPQATPSAPPVAKRDLGGLYLLIAAAAALAAALTAFFVYAPKG